MKAAIEKATREHAYRIRVKRVYESTNTTLCRDHVRKAVSLEAFSQKLAKYLAKSRHISNVHRFAAAANLRCC